MKTSTKTKTKTGAKPETREKGNNGDMEVVWSGPSSGLEGCAKPSPTLPSTLSTSEG